MYIHTDKLILAAEARGARVVRRLEQPEGSSWIIYGDYALQVCPAEKVNDWTYSYEGTRHTCALPEDLTMDGIIALSYEPPMPDIAAHTRKRRYTQLKRALTFCGSCYWCVAPLKSHEARLAYLTPLSQQGVDRYDNLVVSCVKCDDQRGNEVAINDGQNPPTVANVGPAAGAPDEPQQDAEPSSSPIVAENEISVVKVTTTDGIIALSYEPPMPAKPASTPDGSLPSFVVIGYWISSSKTFNTVVDAPDWMEAVCAARDLLKDTTHTQTAIVEVLECRYGDWRAVLDVSKVLTEPIGRAALGKRLRVAMGRYNAQDEFVGFEDTTQADHLLRAVTGFLVARTALWPDGRLFEDFDKFMSEA